MPDTMMLLNDWKYAPRFIIILMQDRMQLISIYVMLSLYIFIITLSAVAVMNYVRSISIAENNKVLFENLLKLGADTSYRQRILKKQLAKIFQYPAVLGCSLGFFFTLGICFMNDGRFTPDEIRTLVIMLAISGVIFALLYGVYRVAKKQAERIVHL